MNHRQKFRTPPPEEENHRHGKSLNDQSEGSPYRRILQRAMETSPFRSLAIRREREKARRLIEKNI